MLNCLCGSWRKTDWGLICRQCGKKKSVEKKQKEESFDPILNHLMGEFNDLTPDDPKDHHQVCSYRIDGIDENGDLIIVVTSIVYDEEKAKEGRWPKALSSWEWRY